MVDSGKVDDLATLSNLNEETLLRELQLRYNKDNIYSYVGDILVAVNPFKQLSIYKSAVQEIYRNLLSKEDGAPHIYAIADRAYHGMLRDKKNQCCVISGESGAGKTESAKYMIQHIIWLCHSGQAGQSIESRILQVNPLLEAFGNAATIMNDNSSRFGKYTELIFDTSGRVCGAKISDYLLEKSRVVRQQHGEQNFHIFYYIFASPLAKKYSLLKHADYPYFRTEQLFSTRKAAEMHEIVVTALRDVGFGEEEMSMLFDVLAAIVQFSHIVFKSPDDHDPAAIADDSVETCKRVGALLGVDNDCFKNALMSTTTITRGEAIVRPYTTSQAIDSRDATAKELYRRMFAWIISFVNSVLDPEGQASAASSQEPRIRLRGNFSNKPKCLMIGILDIFGFENFFLNSFEQLCINLANEQLQNFFNEHVFKSEMEEYRREGVDATDVAYADNQPILELFLGRPIGLFSLLDEESHFPRATDLSLVEKFQDHFKAKKMFFTPQGVDSYEFHIQHYAGTVQYNAFGFLDKNRDSLPPDMVHILSDSSVSVIADSFQAAISSTGQIVPSRARWSSNVGKRKSQLTTNTTNKRALTVSAQFRNSLELLVATMGSRVPHFVRCIKPNTEKLPNAFADDFVLAQLNYTGMLETTRIRKEGYSVRLRFEEFMERFKIIAYSPDTTIEPGTFSCQRILDVAGITNFKIGRTKVFLKYYDADTLDVKVANFKAKAKQLQKVVRGYLQRLRVRAMRLQRDKTHRLAIALFDTIELSSASIQEHHKRLLELDIRRIEAEAAAKAKEEEERAKRSAAALKQQQQQQKQQQEEIAAEKARVAAKEREEATAQAAALQLQKLQLQQQQYQLQQQKQQYQLQQQKQHGIFYDFFHGILSRREAEVLLIDKPIGCFLLRVSATKFGYSLTYRVDTRCRHYLINQKSNKFNLVGSDVSMETLEELIRYYQQNDINEDGDRLTIPCGQAPRSRLQKDVDSNPTGTSDPVIGAAQLPNTLSQRFKAGHSTSTT